MRRVGEGERARMAVVIGANVHSKSIIHTVDATRPGCLCCFAMSLTGCQFLRAYNSLLYSGNKIISTFCCYYMIDQRSTTAVSTTAKTIFRII